MMWGDDVTSGCVLDKGPDTVSTLAWGVAASVWEGSPAGGRNPEWGSGEVGRTACLSQGAYWVVASTEFL